MKMAKVVRACLARLENAGAGMKTMHPVAHGPQGALEVMPRRQIQKSVRVESSDTNSKHKRVYEPSSVCNGSDASGIVH